MPETAGNGIVAPNVQTNVTKGIKMKKMAMMAMAVLFAASINASAWWIFGGKKADAPAKEETPAVEQKADAAAQPAEKKACCAKMTDEQKAACKASKAEKKAEKKAACDAKKAEKKAKKAEGKAKKAEKQAEGKAKKAAADAAPAEAPAKAAE